MVRLLAKCAQKFEAEEAQILRAGLATAPWITVDDTSARHARRDGYTTQIGDDRFTADARMCITQFLKDGIELHSIRQISQRMKRGASLRHIAVE